MVSDQLNRQSKLIARTYLSLVLIVWLLFMARQYRILRQHSQLADSERVCMGLHLALARGQLVVYAEKHQGKILTENEFFQTFKQPTPYISRPEYVWSALPAKKSDKYIRPIVWCTHEHGYNPRWRNVMFDDLSVRSIPVEKLPLLIDRSTPVELVKKSEALIEH